MDTSNRLLALDVFRGMTIAGMILVNNPGSWSTIYGPLKHADWHGCTPTDWVFPFFLFMVGMAIPIALGRRKAAGEGLPDLRRKIIIRTLIIFGLGLLMAAFPRFGFKEGHDNLWIPHLILLGIGLLAIFWRGVSTVAKERKIAGWIALAVALAMLAIGIWAYNLTALRIPGVLQRIALVYCACAFLFLATDMRRQIWIGAGLLLLYWGLMTLVPIPGGVAPNLEAETNLGAWIDRTLLGGHLWSQAITWDPEGLLSTLPAVVTGMIGMQAGNWIKTLRSPYEHLTGIFGVGVLLVALGLTWDLAFPINKKIWTSSYTLYTGGVALLFLGMIYWIVDVLQYRRWTRFFVVYGMNALFVFVLSGLVAKLLGAIKVTDTTNANPGLSLQGWLYENCFKSVFSDYNASLAYALANVAFFWCIAWVLYKRRIFIKV
ncbi:MAG: DUF5009 domain-containing protein [Saprospiraceae bacterium]|nr:DUF5009 domain-containing protein [Saprospiraceae bacterium]